MSINAYGTLRERVNWDDWGTGRRQIELVKYGKDEWAFQKVREELPGKKA